MYVGLLEMKARSIIIHRLCEKLEAQTSLISRYCFMKFVKLFIFRNFVSLDRLSMLL